LSGNFATSSRGGSRSVGTTPVLQLRFKDGRVSTSMNGGARVNRGSTGIATFSDALGTRLNLQPRPSLSIFTDLKTNGSQALSDGGAGRLRTNRFEFGSTRQSGLGQSTVRYDRTERYNYSTGGQTVTNQINLMGSATPRARLSTNGNFNYSTTKTEKGAVLDSRNFRFGLRYVTLWGMRLNANVSIADRGRIQSSAGAFYSLGKTSLNLSFQHSDLPSSSSFSHMSFSLSRSL